ncbi:MAG: glycosyltransferase [Planctomycetota bacterium]
MAKDDPQLKVSSVPAWRRARGRVFVVLPAYNEEANLGPLLERIDQAMHEDSMSYEVVLVDDGSQDATAEVALRYARSIPLHLERHGKNQGLGATIRDGLRVAATRCSPGDIVVAMDADNTHTPGLIRSMVRLIHEGNDVVIASRYQPGSYIRGLSWFRRFLSFAARVLFQVVFPIRGVRDYTCGYRAYRGEILRQAFEKYGDDFVNEEGFQCMVDILLKLRKMDVIFREVPLILRYDQKAGASKMNVGRTIRRTLQLMVRRRFGQ